VNDLNQRPLVGVTAGNCRDEAGRPKLAQNRSYVSALQAAGADVVLLPPPAAGQPPVPAALLDRLDGILLPGGRDVDPARYGEPARQGLGPVDDDLDALELPLVRLAVERRLPLLAICRGQQVVNVALGGTLYQDLARDGATDFPHAADPGRPRDELVHAIDVRPGTRLSQVLGRERVQVNSLHHQAVRDVAPGLVVSATSAVDGIVEGLESAGGLVLAVQCHPEELTAHAWARDLFRSFVATAAGRRAVGAGAGR
jgi:putative glutamine amidotransferase